MEVELILPSRNESLHVAHLCSIVLYTQTCTVLYSNVTLSHMRTSYLRILPCIFCLSEVIPMINFWKKKFTSTLRINVPIKCRAKPKLVLGSVTSNCSWCSVPNGLVQKVATAELTAGVVCVTCMLYPDWDPVRLLLHLQYNLHDLSPLFLDPMTQITCYGKINFYHSPFTVI